MDLRRIQAGEGGWKAGAARAGLSLLSAGWWLGVRAKDAAYALGLRRPSRLPVPVVSVGNLTAGGTGKTPFVAWLVERLREQGRRPGVLSRGYGPPAHGVALSDEGAVLRRLLGEDLPQREDPDRVRGGRALLAAHPDVDVLVLDDGFQHRRVGRDLDVVLLDATEPFGHGRLLPRGLLREPAIALRRAGAVVLTRAERASDADRAALRRRVADLTDVPVAVARTRPVALEVGSEVRSPSDLRGRRVLAASGIGNPAAFAATLADLGAEVVGRADLPDHARLRPLDWERWAARGTAAGAEWVVVTRKDAVKRDGLPPGFVVLDVGVSFDEGADDLLRAVYAALTPAASRSG